MKRYTILGIIVIVSLGLWNTHLMAADIEAVLDSTDGSSSFVVQDSTPTTMGAVDSDGNMVIKGGMRLDSAGVECTTAENLIVDGSVGIGTTSPGTKLEVDGVITATGGTSTNWNTAYTDRLNWNGGTTGLTAATGRSSLGLGSLATLSAVNAATITDNTVGSAELVASPAFTNPTCATPSSSTHVANKAYVDAASGGGCYVSYTGGCLSGFTSAGSAGSWGLCDDYRTHFRPPGGGCYGGWYSHNIGTAYVCCK